MSRLSLRKWRRTGWAVTLFLSTLALSCFAPTTSVSLAQTTTPTESGLVCTTSPNAQFNLTTKSGYINMPDGNTIFTWSYALNNGDFQFPGPFLCVNQGDTVSITLKNTLAEDVSLIIPGIENVQANGILSQPQYNNNQLTSLTQVAAKNGGTITYSFVANQPGTFYYESGTDMSKQVQMGLYGGLIVRPANQPSQAYGFADSKFNAAKEYAMLFSEIDPDLHLAVERGNAYDFTAYHPRYWLINGRSFPDTIESNNSPLLPNQPYGALVHISPYDHTTNPDPALVRYINLGVRNHPFHPHGNHGRVIGRDGQPLRGPNDEDLSYEKFLILVGSAQTWDVTYRWTDVEYWNPATKPIPVTLPAQQDTTYKGNATWYSGSPYLGVQDDLPTGVTSFNQCGEYYHVWHSHALNEATNYDTGFGGMFTLQRIDPPGHPNCQA